MKEPTSTSRLRFIDPLRDWEDQIIFFATFVLGAASIWATKLAHLNQVLVTTIPVVLMILYGLVACRTKRYRLREDRVGDNIYYLGFLFTLTSLSYALYAYNPDGSGATEIITNFGIAITTTIIGLAGRVMMNQMRQDPVEYEREARYSLAEATRELRGQLSDISTEMSVFRRKMIQITEESLSEVTATTVQAISESSKEFSTGAADVFENIHSAFSSFTDHSAKLNVIAEKNVDALQNLFDRIQHIEASPGLLAEKFSPIINKFDEVATETVRRSRGHTNDVKRLKDYIDSAINASNDLSTLTDANHQKILATLESFSERISASHYSLEKFSGALATTTGAISEGFSAVSEASAAMRNSVSDQSNEAITASAAMKINVDAARLHKVQLDKLVVESQRSLTELQAALVSLAGAMVDGLRDRTSHYPN